MKYYISLLFLSVLCLSAADQREDGLPLPQQVEKSVAITCQEGSYYLVATSAQDAVRKRDEIRL